MFTETQQTNIRKAGREYRDVLGKLRRGFRDAARELQEASLCVEAWIPLRTPEASSDLHGGGPAFGFAFVENDWRLAFAPHCIETTNDDGLPSHQVEGVIQLAGAPLRAQKEGAERLPELLDALIARARAEVAVLRGVEVG